LENVASVLQTRELIAEFIKAMRIEDPNATHQEVMSNINAFVDTLEPSLGEKVHSILEAKRSEQNIGIVSFYIAHSTGKAFTISIDKNWLSRPSLKLSTTGRSS
jgi:hypothetical protein